MGERTDPAVVDDIAGVLDAAAVSGQAITPVGISSLHLAYEVQSALVERRLARGESRVGWKLGFTSASKMRQMGVSEVIVGQLTSQMNWTGEHEAGPPRLIHPRAEPEIAFLLDGDIQCAQDPPGTLRSVVSRVAVALEVIDSRYVDFKFGVGDVVADNASAVGYATGPWSIASERSPLGEHTIELFVNGSRVAVGPAREILGDPWSSLDEFESVARGRGWVLHRGDVILAGAVTAAVGVRPGDRVEARSRDLGSVEATIPGSSANRTESRMT